MLRPFAVCILAVIIGGQLLAQDRPLVRVHQGRMEPLVRIENRVAVRLNAGVDPIAAVASAGVVVIDAEPTGVPGWHLITLDTSPSTSGLQSTIDALIGGPIDFASPVFAGMNGGWAFVTPDVLMRAKSPAHLEEAVGLASVEGLQVVERRFGDFEDAVRCRARHVSGFDVLARANRLAAAPSVAWAEPDWQFSGRGTLIPNDTLFARCWGHRNTGQFGTLDMDMDSDLAWDLTIGSASVKVLIIDTGVEQNHPDLNQLPGADLTSQTGNGGPVNACDNHGTPVAGCVSATINNNLGTVGVAPGCKSVSARTFISLPNCFGGWTTQTSWTVNALTFGERQGVKVTNNSNLYAFPTNAIDAKYASTRANGMVHFAAAGNASRNVVGYPASSPAVNAVSALDSLGSLALFSSYGPGLAYSAPGTDIITTDRTGSAGYSPSDYANMVGTSFASPYAAGIAALVLSQSPGMSAEFVELALRAGRDRGTKGYDTRYGWCFVNANSALRSIPYGQGLAGTGGITPTLFVLGVLRVGRAIALTIDRGRGGSAGVVVLGTTAAAQPFRGGTLLVAPPFAPLSLSLSGAPGTAGTGRGAIDYTIPNTSVLVGTRFYVQGGLADPAAVQGMSLTNGLEVVIGA